MSRNSGSRWMILGAGLLFGLAGLARTEEPVPLPGAGPGAAPLLPLEQLFADSQEAEAKLSPDGRSLAFLAPFEGTSNLWVRPLPAGEARVVTRKTDRPVAFYRWSADGRYLLHLEDQGGNEDFHLHVVRVGRTIGPDRDLTPFAGAHAEIIGLPRRRPGSVVVALHRRDPERADAYRLDLASGRLELAAENTGDFLEYLADDRGRVLLARSLDAQGRYGLHVRPNEREPWHRLRTYEVGDEVTPLAFHPDGRRVYLSSNQGRDLASLALLDLATGAETVVAGDPAGRVDLELAIFDPRRGEPVATRFYDDLPRWEPRDSRVKRALDLAARARSGAVHLTSWSDDLERFVATIEAANDPGGTYLLDLGRDTAKLLSEARPWLTPGTNGTRLADTRPVRFTARDGLPLSGYLTEPTTATPKPWPLLLAVHGGPWARDTWGFDPENQLFANRGYAILQVNFRGSTGFGKAFARAARKQFGQAMQTDLLDAVQWAVAQGLADPRRVAIIGGSYGGYAVLEGLVQSPEVFACGVDYAGPSDLITLIESFPPSWRPYLSRRWHPFVGDPADPVDREDLRRRSPLHRSEAIEDPLLIFQGANDPRVTREQSDSIVQALVRRGVPVTYLVAGNEGHSFGTRQTSLGVRRATETFLGRCLGGRVQPEVSAEVEEAVTALTRVSP